MGFFRRTLLGLQRRGISGTFGRLLSMFEERLFDWRYGTDTVGATPLSELALEGELLRGASPYEPTRLRPFRQVMRLLKPSRNSVLLDFGCGKGRVLLVAAQFGFKRIEGVEFAKQLCKIAENNVAAYKARTCSQTEFRIVESDAANYEIQDDVDYFYFFNPFGEEVMRSTMRNIVRSIDRRPRDATLIYCNPRSKQCIEETGIFQLFGGFVFNEFAVYTNRKLSQCQMLPGKSQT
jgi:SAM-dependent methyltransferase